MKLFILISSYIIPFIIFYIVTYGIIHKTPVYDKFVDGAKDGMKTVVGILPTLIGLMVAVGILRASGFLDFLGGILGNATKYIGVPKEMVPLIIVRMFSASAATGLTLDLFKNYGTDTFIGTAVSILMGCTETVFYTMSVYYMAAKVTKSKWTLQGALLSVFAGVAASIILAHFLV